MDVEPIAQLLKTSIGLDMASVSKSFIEAAIKSRIAKTQTSNIDHYLQRLQDVPMELAELIEEAVIPETWFFRDVEAIWSMVRNAKERLFSEDKAELRILSLPCASGEEPYSLAMALIDAGISSRRFQIDAVDVSQRALEQARLAVYGNNAFRGIAMQPFRERYFDRIDKGWQLHDGIRKLVEFRQGNLLEANFTLEKGSYDMVFCRNLLIYFDRETQIRATNLLLSLLRPRATIYVGPAEGGLLLEQGLRSNAVPLAFGFQHCQQTFSTKVQPVKPINKVKPVIRPNVTIQPMQAKTKPTFEPIPISQSLPTQKANSKLSLAEITHLANQGRLVEAISQYESFIKVNGQSAQALYSLALAQDANGDHIQAERNYRKALYLDPTHQEAITHLALLLDVLGDPVTAKQLRQRAARLEATKHG
jgi:chemotaxis protein methyltransferase WspC